MEISDRLRQRLFEAIETGIAHALTRRDVPGNEDPLDITVPQDSSVYNKHCRLFYEILKYIGFGWSCPDGKPEKEMTDSLHEMIDEETLDFFTRIMTGFDEFPEECRQLIEEHHMREMFISCIDFIDKDEYEGWRKAELVLKWTPNDVLMNYVDVESMKLLGRRWFDEAWPFVNGFCTVKVSGRGWNYLDLDGNLLLDQCVHDCGDFKDVGYASITRGAVNSDDMEENFINRKGEVMFDKWFIMTFVQYLEGTKMFSEISVEDNRIVVKDMFGDTFVSDRTLK